jgi:hypothetical protein
LQRDDCLRTDPAGSDGLQRVAARALDRRQAQRVDRRFAHRNARQMAGAAGRRNSVLSPPAEKMR